MQKRWMSGLVQSEEAVINGQMKCLMVGGRGKAYVISKTSLLI